MRSLRKNRGRQEPPPLLPLEDPPEEADMDTIDTEIKAKRNNMIPNYSPRQNDVISTKIISELISKNMSSQLQQINSPRINFISTF